ncbi:MFS transporter [Streptomyces misionensis]|uniref:MFS transporter n=1 Tax=Streptomyces misionensis TaxID=67331 RepID=UPI0033FDCDF5
MTETDNNPPPATPHQRATMIVTCIGTFMVLLDVSIVNTALPAIQRGLHSSFSQLQWVVDAYALAFATLLLTAGGLADRFGRKRLFQIGMVVFAVGSVLCGFAVSSAELNAARVLQGIGGAALAPSSLALLATAFPDAGQRVKAVSVWAAISGIALGVGPTVGGILVTDAGWRWVFFINAPIGALCLLFGVRVLRESTNPHARRLDLPGQVASVIWLGALTYGFVERGSHPWGSTRVWAPLAAAVVALFAFLIIERRSSEPMLPLELFRARLFSMTALVTFLLGFVMLTVPFFTAQYFQDVQHFSALQAGLRILAFTLMMSIIAPIAGRLTRRFGFHVPVTLGSLISAAGLFTMTGISVTSPYVEVFWRLALIGIGFGLMLSPLSAAALNAVSPHRAGLASSVANTTRQAGTVIGIALLGALVQNRVVKSSLDALKPLPDSVATPLAKELGHGGAQTPLPSALPPGLTPERLHQVSQTAYVSGIHGAYLVGGIVLLAAAGVAAAFLRPIRVQRLPATRPAVEEIAAP